MMGKSIRIPIRNCNGSASFAIIAVLLLVLAGISIAYIGRMNYKNESEKLKRNIILQLENELNIFHTAIETKANIFGMSAVMLATQIEENSSRINDYFIDSFSRYISEQNEKNISPNGNYVLHIDSYNISLCLARKTTHDILVSEVNDLTVAGNYSATNLPTYYAVDGYVNYTITAPDTGLSMRKRFSVHREIDCAYPFLAEKFKLMHGSGSGSTSDIGRMIKYILTTIAQYRTFQGYGAKNFPNLRVAPGSALDIITPKDVEIATNTAILLEIIKNYRNVDEGAVENFGLNYTQNIRDRAFHKLLADYVHNGLVDPADIVALFICIDEKPIDVSAIFAQSLYAIIDEYVLKYLDYLSISENLDVMRGFIGKFLEWFGIELDSNAEIVVDTNNVELSAGAYRFESNATKTRIIEMINLICSDGWQFANDCWLCTGGNEDSIMYESVNISLNSCGYRIYPPPPDESLHGTVFFAKAQTAHLKFKYKFTSELPSANPRILRTDVSRCEEFQIPKQLIRSAHEYESACNDTEGAVLIRKNAADAWETIGVCGLTRMDANAGSAWCAESIVVPEDYLRNGVQFGWRFSSENQSSKWYVKDIQIEDIVDGADVCDKDIPQETYSVENYRSDSLIDTICTIIKNTVSNVTSFLSGIYDAAAQVITDMFKALAQYISDIIVKLLFGGEENYPRLEINPNDCISITETTKNTLTNWVENGIEELKVNVTSEIDWLVESAENFLANVIYKLRDYVLSAFNNILNKVEGWVEKQISKVADAVRVVVGVVDAVVGGIFWVLGQSDKYEEAKDYVRKNGEKFWNDLKNGIRDVVNGIISNVTNIFVNILGVAFSAIDFVLDHVLDALRNLIGMFLNALKKFIVLVITLMMSGDEITNTKFVQYLHYQKNGENFEFWDGNCRNNSVYECVVVNQTPNYLQIDALCSGNTYSCAKQMNIRGVAEGDSEVNCAYDSIYRSPEEYKLWVDMDANNDGVYDANDITGVHYTRPSENSSRPFENTWNINIYGKIHLSTRTDKRILLYDGIHQFAWKNDTVEIRISIPVTVYSGWDLEGVNYNFTTLLEDIIDFLTAVWDNIVSIVSIAINIITKISEVLSNIISAVINFAFYIVEFISNLIMNVIDCIQKFLSNILGTVINLILDCLRILGAKSFKFSAFGIAFAVYTDPDINGCGFYADADIVELFSIASEISILGSYAGFRLDAIICQNAYDIVFTGNIDICDIILNVTADPLMAVSEHMVEAHGKSTDENNNGFGFDIYFPEIEITKEVSFSIPITPVPIPIPMLGVQASVEIGAELVYDAPVVDHVVINEFELSSATGEQWVELCNPTDTDINLDGWSISTLTGERKVQTLTLNDCVPSAHRNSCGYLVVTLQQNFNSGNGDIGLVLRDKNNKIIDRTPLRRDNYRDARTWQRAYDCGLVWIFHDASRNGGNPDVNAPATPHLDFYALLLSSITDCFSETKAEFDAIPVNDIGYVVDFAHAFLAKLKNKVLEIIKEVVVEITFYIDLIIEAIGTGAGGGLRLSFVMDGCAASSILNWLCENIQDYILNIGSTNFHKGSSSLPEDIGEHLFIRLEAYGNVAVMPKVLREITPNTNFCIEVSSLIQVNMALLTSLVGINTGNWKAEFGIAISCSVEQSGFLLGKGQSLDIWLLRASIYRIGS